MTVIFLPSYGGRLRSPIGDQNLEG